MKLILTQAGYGPAAGLFRLDVDEELVDTHPPGPGKPLLVPPSMIAQPGGDGAWTYSKLGAAVAEELPWDGLEEVQFTRYGLRFEVGRAFDAEQVIGRMVQAFEVAASQMDRPRGLDFTDTRPQPPAEVELQARMEA